MADLVHGEEEAKKAELPNDIPGQTEIEKDFPELLPISEILQYSLPAILRL